MSDEKLSSIIRAHLGASDADWGSRIGAIQQHFRRTYRIEKKVVDRLRSIKAIRFGTIDPVSGTRAPATAYQDWAVIASQRYFATQLAQGKTKTGSLYLFGVDVVELLKGFKQLIHILWINSYALVFYANY